MGVITHHWLSSVRSGSEILNLKFALLILFLLTGCTSSGPKTVESAQGNKAPINSWLGSREDDIPVAVYRIGPQDKLKIVAPKVKELDSKEIGVRADGRISLTMVGEIEVNNLTPAEVSDQIVKKLGKFYDASTIDVSVQVTEFKSKVYYVMGQVVLPGVKPYTGRDTIVKAVAAAKMNDSAWPEKIVIIRPNEDVNIKQRVTVDIKAMYDTGTTAQNYVIEPGDVIYVPLSPLAEIALTFQRVIYPIVPATNLGGMILRGGL